MTIADLKKVIQDLPDDMLIGRWGHFGELIPLDGVFVEPVYTKEKVPGVLEDKVPCLILEVGDLGPDPD